MARRISYEHTIVVCKVCGSRDEADCRDHFEDVTPRTLVVLRGSTTLPSTTDTDDVDAKPMA